MCVETKTLEFNYELAQDNFLTAWNLKKGKENIVKRLNCKQKFSVQKVYSDFESYRVNKKQMAQRRIAIPFLPSKLFAVENVSKAFTTFAIRQNDY